MYATDLMGLTLDNPVIIAPGPWSRGEKLKDALQCNAGAIITESIVSESYSDTCPRYTYSNDNRGIQNIRLYSALELEEWIHWLSEAQKKNRYGSSSKLIASIMGTSPSELSYIAKKIEKTGIEGIEIGFACPMGEGQDIIAGDPERVYAYTCEVVKAVHVPVSVKLSAAVGIRCRGSCWKSRRIGDQRDRYSSLHPENRHRKRQTGSSYIRWLFRCADPSHRSCDHRKYRTMHRSSCHWHGRDRKLRKSH